MFPYGVEVEAHHAQRPRERVNGGVENPVATTSFVLSGEHIDYSRKRQCDVIHSTTAHIPSSDPGTDARVTQASRMVCSLKPLIYMSMSTKGWVKLLYIADKVM